MARRRSTATIHLLIFYVLLDLTTSDQRHDESYCRDSFGRAQRCIPEFVNAAFNIKVESTNTCGTNGPLEFCVQTGVTAAQKFCDICDASASKYSHGPEYLTDFNNEDNLTWWQSDTLLEARDRHRDSLPSGAQIPLQVNLTLRLGKSFDITYVRLKFYSPRPESFSIYKRTNEESPWIPYQYYSGTCRDTYSLPDSLHILGDDETQPLCTSEYSDISPLTGGNVAFSTLEGRPSANNFENSLVLQEWVTATDIQIRLDRLNLFGDEVFGDPKVLKSYFYAVSDLAVGGRCKCNGHASECVKYGDQLICQCEHNTDGVDCEKCLPFYNDKPWKHANGTHANECEPCNCSGRSNRCYFNATLFEQTQGRTGGHCTDCVGNFAGPNCNDCRENYYLQYDGQCVQCECNDIGSFSLQCDNHGQCQCKPGVTGEKCDRCDANYYDFNFQGCRACGCEIAGSFRNNPTCDSGNGLCQCKDNVEGRQCNSCKPGFFNIDEENEFGCTPCFCYGHSSICHSFPGYSKTSIESSFNRDAEQWTARDKHSNTVPMQYNALVQNIAVSAPSAHTTAYFIAPRHFLGDQRATYNQHLSFELRVNNDRSQATIEDVVLEGMGMKVSQPIFGQGNALPDTQSKEYKFRLHEHENFAWVPTLSARDLISLLSNLTAIKIHATYTPDGVGFLDNVKLESAQRGSHGQEAKWIEICTCIEGYVGQYCESCAPGYRHDPPGNNPFSRCIPCNCHGHADICDDATGRCICRDNTAGDYCERCARGYYGNAQEGTPLDCQPCPCPNQGSCIDFGGGEVACLECPEGYGGHRCDACTDGYYGDPLGRYGYTSPCQKCDCNGNVDPNAVGNCNKTSGDCMKCIYNTAGVHCDRCLPGFHGDALAIPKGDCKPCNCDPYGSLRRDHGPVYCDSLSGECECQPYVRGKQCDKCVEGYWNLESSQGCESCNCDSVGSKNYSCDVRNGQCFCRPGVTGQQCDQCATYHYDFSDEGCKACDCDPIGAVNLQCELQTGQCQCRQNVEGRRCDRCKENKYDKHLGCIDCPDCYNLVQDAVSEHRVKLVELEQLIISINENPGVVNDYDFQSKLNDVMRRVSNLLNDAKSAGNVEFNLQDQLDELHKRLQPMQGNVEKITEKIDFANVESKSGVRNITLAEEIIKRIREALKNAQKNIREDGELALEKAIEKSKVVGQQSERMSQIASEARETADNQESEAVRILALAKQALNTSREAYRIASEAFRQQSESADEMHKLRLDLKDAEELMKRTKKLANDAQVEATMAYEEALAAYTDATGVLLPDTDADSMKATAEEIIEEAKAIQDEADALMQRHQKSLDELQSQMNDAEDLLAVGHEKQQVTDRLFAEVDLALDTANSAVALGEATLEEANKTLETLRGFDHLVQQSKKTADEALKKIPEIEKLIQQAEGKTREAKGSLTNAEKDANDARNIAIEAQKIAEQASKEAGLIRHEADETRKRAGKLSDDADDLANEVAETAAQLQGLDDQADSDKALVKEASENANDARDKAEKSSKEIKDALNTVNEILEILNKVGSIDTNQLRALEAKLVAAEADLAKADLDRRLDELRKARKQQSMWMRDYEEELIILRRDVLNIKSIRESLPSKCFSRVTLEPEQ